MSQQAQEIIVYSSPAQKAFWDCFYDNPEVFLWIVGIIIGIILLACIWEPFCNWFSRTFKSRPSNNRWDYHR